VTPTLFRQYPDAQRLASADRSQLEAIITSTGFFRAKADNLLKLGAALSTQFDGEVPATIDELVTLPGVGRKTANVVLGEAFGMPGITVDTHFGRLSRRLGWTTLQDPVKVEHEVGALFPEKEWTHLSQVLIWHGRRPACGACTVAQWCPSFGEGPTDPVKAAALVREPRG